MSEKRCSHCRDIKPASDFYVSTNPYGRRYVQSWCKACKAEAMRVARLRISPPRKDRLFFPAYGERSHKAKLVNDDIRLIRGLLDSGLNCAEVARKFEVSRQTVSAIKSGRTWTHI